MIRHILKDGTEVKNIAGYVVRMEDAKSIYALLDALNNKPRRTKENGENNR